MNELNKKKLLSGAVACALLIGAVALVQRFPLVSDFLTASAQIPATARFASSTKPMAGKQSAASLVAAVSSVVNINTASKERLMTLHGIGSAKSDAIVNYRNAHGIFYRPEDIMNVSGIGTAMYESIRNTITVGNVTPPRAKPPLSALAPAATSSPAHVVISQIMAGMKGNAGYEYIELYNAGTGPVALDGWSIKKKTSTGSISMLISSSRLSGKTIPAGKHFLLAGSGYTGLPAADLVWPSSYTFASSNNTVILYSGAGQVADDAAWSDIPEGKSYTRASPDSKNFMVADPQPHSSSN